MLETSKGFHQNYLELIEISSDLFRIIEIELITDRKIKEI